MRQMPSMLSLLAMLGMIWIHPFRLSAQSDPSKPQPGYQWTNAGVTGPRWLSQYPLSAQTTQLPFFSSNFPLGINKTTGLTSNGENLLVAEGTLNRIDSQGQRLWIRTSTEEEKVFHYTSATQTLGAAGSVEGLAPMGGTQLRVLYTREGGRDNAVHIEMEPSSTPYRTSPHLAFP